MPRYLLIAALAMLCGCGPRRVTPNAGSTRTITEVEPPAAGETTPIVRPIVDPPPTPPRPPIIRPKPAPTLDEVVSSTNASLLDVFFPYDRSELTDDAIAALRKDADILRPIFAEFPQLQVTIEGYCDERGSAEYNIGLGDRRARRAADLLESFGIAAARLRMISYGKESPQCAEAAESCWSRNRRAHLSVGVEGTDMMP